MMSKTKHLARLLNVGLRLLSLAAKFGLTLYMGRYLCLQDLGMYGLVNGAVIIIMTALGVRFDYVVARELVGAEPREAFLKMRDQAVFLGLNYVLLAFAIVIVTFSGATDVAPLVMLAIFVLSIIENAGGMASANMIALGKPVMANIVFFVRAAMWVIPVVALGFLDSKFRNSNTIFVAWAIGGTLSLLLTFWALRRLPWREARRTPIDWKWIRSGVNRCFFIWLGATGATGAMFVDRFVVVHDLGLDLTGVVTFYASFLGSIWALVQSGVIAFAYPRLVEAYKEKDHGNFWREVKKLAWHVALSTGAIVIVYGVSIPVIGGLFHRPLLVEYTSTFWLMLGGMWIRVNAETLYYILFARHQDRAIWLGDLLFLLPSLCSNLILVPLIGFQGIGYSMIIASSFLFVWRGWHVKFGLRAEKRM